MRILLTSNASYAPPRGGSTRSNLVWLRHLVASGHKCRVVAPNLSDESVRVSGEGGISIVSVKDLSRRTAILTEQIALFAPDWVLVSSEDLSHVLLREASEAAPGRIVYLAHTPQFFPFGPESWNPDSAASQIVRNARAVVAIGTHVAGYIRQHLDREAVVIHPPIYGEPPYPDLSSYDDGMVLMINPCKVKGIRIFLALGERFPAIPFGALTGWGTTSSDRRALEKLPNVRLLANVPKIEDVLSQARLLLMPSLWYEGFGLIAMEAMLRGLPVISSDSGGLIEAKRGTGFVIPVKPVTSYEPVFDENHMPKPVVAAQNIEPWAEALNTLLSDREAYENEAARSRQAALNFVTGLHAGDFEKLLNELAAKPSPAVRVPTIRMKMRILLAHNSLYFPSLGGGDKSNRLLMEALAERGHEVLVVTRVENFGPEDHADLLAQLAVRGVNADTSEPGTIRFTRNGVRVHVVSLNPHLRAYFSKQISEFDPDVIITSTDDPAQLLFDLAIRTPRARVVYLIRATIAVPFGPDSSSQNATRTEMLRRADAVVGVSESVAHYAREWGGMDAVHVPISLMERRECPLVGKYENPYVVMVNPCAVKGIGIFLALAERLPHLQFAAVPMWGTTPDDLAAMRKLPNITLLDAVDNIDGILRQTRVMLVPSVWAEARSRMVLESMSRGVPVMASNIGGIPEAKLGVDYLLPVNPVVRYKPVVDGRMVPVAEIPAQDIHPWEIALRRLTSDRAHWEQIASESRVAALHYIENLNVLPFEALLRKILLSPKRGPLTPAAAEASAAGNLSAEKRRLLALRVRRKIAEARKAAGNLWFPDAADAPAGKPRLFCFPYAGGGAATYARWKSALGNVATVCPARLPGRESRIAEQPIDEMHALVKTAADNLVQFTDRPFVLFGHSMGATIAFEIARLLRRRKLPLPRALIVSGARAPRFRLNHTPPPEPTDEEFMAELRALEGMPREILDNPEILALAIPALRADSRVYRNYIYQPEAPLAIPIFAYSGDSDPRITPEQVSAWGRQTTSAFRHRRFNGGHFFIQTDEAEVLAALRDDLATSAR